MAKAYLSLRESCFTKISITKQHESRLKMSFANGLGFLMMLEHSLDHFRPENERDNDTKAIQP